MIVLVWISGSNNENWLEGNEGLLEASFSIC